MKKTAVIMAGGRGERFWPQSRADMPKQFLSLTSDGKTMIQLTVERLLPIMELDDIFIVTNRSYQDIVRQQLPGLPEQNILCEPMAKNTAPCVAYAAAVIAAKYGDAVICVLASDHIIKNNRLFADTLQTACDMAQQNSNIVTLGITPFYPETGYGYIQFERAGAGGVYRVARFVEKPDLATAQAYLADGTYLWNSGMFIWKASTVLANVGKYLPEMMPGVQKIGAALGTPDYEKAVYEFFDGVQSVSVDYGIMEKASDIYTIPGSFGWDDVGGWLSLERINPVNAQGNVIKGSVVECGSEGNVLISGGRLIAAVGVQNLVVVDTPDVTLVCNKDNTQDVKKIVQMLRERGETQYL